MILHNKKKINKIIKNIGKTNIARFFKVKIRLKWVWNKLINSSKKKKRKKRQLKKNLKFKKKYLWINCSIQKKFHLWKHKNIKTIKIGLKFKKISLKLIKKYYIYKHIYLTDFFRWELKRIYQIFTMYRREKSVWIKLI